MAVKNLSFGGGGAKGAGMPGVYSALTKLRSPDSNDSMFDQIETIAGTSVGSISAAFFSVSPKWEDFKKEVYNQNLLSILQIDQAYIPVDLSLQPLQIFINEYLKKHISEYLACRELHELNNDLKSLRQRIENASYYITFSDMNVLHQHNPKKFKDLILTSTISKNGEAKLVLHDYRRTPTDSIAVTCAASSSIFPTFKPVLINDVFHCDGGYTDPLPTKVFENEDNLETYVFAFSSGPNSILGQAWFQTLHGRPNPRLEFVSSCEHTLVSSTDMAVFIDINSRKVFYRLPISEKWHDIDFDKLGIESINILDEKIFMSSYLHKFNEILINRKHLTSILEGNSFIWWLNFLSFFLSFFLRFSLNLASLLESLCQRIQAYHQFNTVLLHSTLTGDSFLEAEKTKRTISATYALYTMNHATYTERAAAEDQYFYKKIVADYLKFYNTLLNAINVEENWYTKQYDDAKTTEVLYQMILDDVTQNHSSDRAMALTWAVELFLGHITEQEILEELNTKARTKCEKFSSFFYGHRYKKQEEFLLPTSEIASNLAI